MFRDANAGELLGAAAVGAPTPTAAAGLAIRGIVFETLRLQSAIVYKRF